MNLEDVIKLIAQGEGETVEFKLKPAGVAKTVCAMANTSGGDIIIKVSDKGEIIRISEKEIERINSDIQGLIPVPKVSISTIKIKRKKIVVVKVEKSKRLVSLGNIAYIRIGSSNKALDIEELAVLSVEEIKITFDSLPSDVSVNRINKELVREYLELRRQIINIPVRGKFEDNIRKLGIVKENKLTFAGVLFFTDNPQEIIEWSGVRVIELYPDGETKEIKEFTGPLWKMIDDVYAEIIRKIPRTDILTGARRERLPLFPEEAVREAIINAVAHRNYRIMADIRIFIKPDSLRVKNPGNFPPGVDPDNPEDIPRNPKLCQFLYDTGYIEKYGYGIIRMKEAVKSHPFTSLEFNLNPLGTEVIFRTKAGELNETERLITALLHEGPKTSTELASRTGFSRVALLKKVARLESLNLIKKIRERRSHKIPSFVNMRLRKMVYKRLTNIHNHHQLSNKILCINGSVR